MPRDAQARRELLAELCARVEMAEEEHREAVDALAAAEIRVHDASRRLSALQAKLRDLEATPWP